MGHRCEGSSMGILSSKAEVAPAVLVPSELLGKEALHVCLGLSELQRNGKCVNDITLSKESRVIKGVWGSEDWRINNVFCPYQS